jgi:4,5-DOPA dioxygenase extradiol
MEVGVKSKEQSSSTPRVIYLSHGGGPLPLLGDEGHREMVAVLKKLAAGIDRPAAIVVISAHWEASAVSITSAATPGLLYDYYGFPEESYAISYAPPGAPKLAAALGKSLADKGFDVELDRQRGLDHGVFVPLKIMYPQADIPCVQLSLLADLDPARHIRLGEAMASVAGAELLVIGSGFSFHNMRAFFTADTRETAAMNQAFDSWLVETCSSTTLGEEERRRRLVHWSEAPHARYCHPREEHLLPLHVCYGLTGRACSEVQSLRIMAKRASTFLW